MSEWREDFLSQDESGKLIEAELYDGTMFVGRYHLDWEWEHGEEVAYGTIITENGEEHACGDWTVDRWRLAKESKQ